MSARKDVTDKIKALAKSVRNSAYFVKRGYINWATFDFTSYPRAISILVDEERLLRDTKGFADARISLEIFTKIPPSTDPPQIDDGVLDELIDDARWIVEQLEQARNAQGDPVVFKISRNTSALVESHDATLEVQGIVAIIRVTY